MLRKTLFTTLFGLVCASAVTAQPVIVSVDGEWENGTTIVLQGTFGAKTTSAPRLWDTLDNQAGYASRGVAHGDIVPSTSGDWGEPACPDCPWDINQPDWTSPMRFWAEDHRVDGRPFYRVERKGYFRMNDFGDADPDRFYMSWWFRTSAPDLADGSNKFVRLWADTERPEGSMSWTGMHFTYTPDANHDGVNDAGDSHVTEWGGWGGGRNTWHHMELIYDGSGDIQHGYGKVTLRRDGQTLHQADDAYGMLPWNRLYVFGFDASVSTTFAGETFDFSEIYIDTSLARVVAADASTWGASSHFEMQVPTSWASDRIEAVSNVGTFGPGQDVWLYVFDEDGLVNPVGYPLTAPDPGPPGQPGQPVIE